MGDTSSTTTIELTHHIQMGIRRSPIMNFVNWKSLVNILFYYLLLMTCSHLRKRYESKTFCDKKNWSRPVGPITVLSLPECTVFGAYPSYLKHYFLCVNIRYCQVIYLKILFPCHYPLSSQKPVLQSWFLFTYWRVWGKFQGLSKLHQFEFHFISP